MKQFKLLWSIPFLFMTGLILQSCGSGEGSIDNIDNIDNIKKEEPIVEKYYDVSLALDGIEVSEEPLTRDETDELKTVYKIIVYYNRNGDGDVSYEYANGTFDNVSDMQLSMLAGHKYRFICSIWKEVTGETQLSRFRGFGKNTGDITNKFNIVQSSSSTSSLIPYLFQSPSFTYDSDYYSLNYYEDKSFLRTYTRFYGELSDYTPTQNGTAIIRMIESSRYGLHVTIMPPSEGQLNVSSNNYYYYYYYENGYYYYTTNKEYIYITLTNTSEKYDDGGLQFIVGENVMDHWSDVFYGRTINEDVMDLPIEITWTNYNEAGVQIGNSSITKAVKLKRDLMVNINIDLSINNAETNNASIGFNYDSNELTTSEENWTVTVDENGTMDVTVIPQ